MFGAPTSRRSLLLGAAALAGATALGSGCSRDDGNALRLRVLALSYGTHPMQSGDLHVPLTGRNHPVVVLIHGGYWATGFERGVMRPLAEELVNLGYAVWNIDYRRVGDEGGGWPGTLVDVADAVDHLTTLADEHGLALDQVVIIGHSAGSQLAFWAGSRPTSSNGPGSTPSSTAAGDLGPAATARVRAAALASLSGVLDLDMAATLPDLGRLADLRRATIAFLGGTPEDVPERYAEASPIRRVPMRAPQLLLHGVDDEIVPVQLTSNYRDAAEAAGDKVMANLVDGVDHFDTASANKAWWSAVLSWLPTVITIPR